MEQNGEKFKLSKAVVTSVINSFYLLNLLCRKSDHIQVPSETFSKRVKRRKFNCSTFKDPLSIHRMYFISPPHHKKFKI